MKFNYESEIVIITDENAIEMHAYDMKTYFSYDK
jgi:hypothetical protein